MLNKQKIFGLLILFFFSSYAFCVDRVVQLNGPSGTYNSITDAVNASSDGDIIIVNNKPSNLPWIEDVTISKSLTFVSALDTVQFFVQGNYFIERGANREVVINGMRNNNGNIEETGTNTPTSRTKVSILNCEINGDVDFGQRYNLLISNSAIFDQVNFTYGSVYGSEIGGYMQLNRDFWADSDTLNIVGNKLFRLTLTTDSHYVHVLNNFIYNTNTGGIYVGALKGGTGENHITNNSIYSRYDAINAFVSTQAILIIQNNALRSTTTNDHSFDNNSGPGLQVVFNYNVYHSV
ncbi:MAG: hypothetical protein MRY83_19985, partial [Flavobacteriales bacterium]|nr:hypothetical protein [Flavobacteriales bacterium]